MTGNNKFWRASLAGLASVAMLATMGVAASTANAANPVDESDDFVVQVYDKDKPYNALTDAYDYETNHQVYHYGQVFEVSDIKNPYAGVDGKVLTGYSYDLAGKNLAFQANPNVEGVNGFAVKGDTKLYAQYATAHKVTFVVKNPVTRTDESVSVDVKDASALDASTYYGAKISGDSVEQYAIDHAAYDQVFVGWVQSDHQDSEDLYTNGAIKSDTTLYAKYVDANSKNAAQVDFKDAQDGDAQTKFTLADQAFPEFRADPALKNAEWQSGDKAYDFTKPVANDKKGVDLSLLGVSKATDNVWTVIYHFNGKNDSKVRGVLPTYGNPVSGAESWRGNTEAYTAADGKAVEPGTPALTGAEFTGWYQSDNDKAFDFNTPVSAQAEAQDGSKTINLYAGWKTNNIVPVAYYYSYNIDQDYGAVDGYDSKWLEPYSDVTSRDGAVVAKKASGKALNYQTAGTAIQQPTGIEDYFATAENLDHGTYTPRKVTGWKAVLSGAPITTVNASVSVYAQWAQAQSLFLDANGGNWGGANHTQYVTKDTNQSWADVVKAPSRDGYRFTGWTVSGYHVNLADGNYYDFFGVKQGSLADGDQLLAHWVSTSREDIWALWSRFNLSGFNKAADVKTVTDAGYTEASAKAYVDAWYDLNDDFYAAQAKTGQDQIDAFNALVPKYQAAQAKLVKSDVPVKPAPATKVPVYRLYNKYITTGTNHLFTTDESEYNLLSAKGWTPEGVVFESTSDKNATPVYRLYNKYDGSHHYTKDAAERDNLVKLGWTYEFVGFYAPADGDATLYRLYNQYNGEHLFTTDKAENDKLVSLGWTAEESGLKVYSAAK